MPVGPSRKHYLQRQLDDLARVGRAEALAERAYERIVVLESALRAARHYVAGGQDDLKHSRAETLEFVDAVLRGDAGVVAGLAQRERE